MDKLLLLLVAAFLSFFMLVVNVSFWAGGGTLFPDVALINRQYVVFKDEEALHKRDAPFLIKATLVSENANNAVFDIIYFIPPNDSASYSIGIYPERGEFSSDQNILKSGKNLVRTYIRFKPTAIFTRWIKTEYLDMSIHKNGYELGGDSGGVSVQKIYRRRVIFPKTWRRKAPVLRNARPMEFRVN